MPDLKTSAGPYDVFASGSLLSYDLQDFTIELASGFNLVVRVEFNDGEDTAIKFEASKSDTLMVVIKNPIFGYGLSTPIKIGAVDGRQIFLAMRVDGFGQPVTSYRFDYTIFKGASA